MSSFGIELEWFVLLVVALLGEIFFGHFEAGTQKWKRLLKWGLILVMTYATYVWVGHGALALIVALTATGLSIHFWWCKRHGIHPLKATPRDKYIRLRGWPEPPA